jgi:hypothetical protein
MTRQTRVLGALIVGLAAAQPAVAQEKAVRLSVRGGGFNGLSSLNEGETADFKKVGYSVGGGVGVDVHRNVGLRGDFTFARNELQEGDADSGLDLNRFFYDAALQFQIPTESGWEPYLFVGAGAVTLHPVGTTESDETKPAGTAGLGVSYRIPGSNLGIVLEGKGFVYNLSEMSGELAGFDKTQFDVTWNAGFSYRFPFGSRAARVSR